MHNHASCEHVEHASVLARVPFGSIQKFAPSWVGDPRATPDCCSGYVLQIKELLSNVQAQKRGGKDASSGGGGLLAAKAKISGGAGKRQETAPAA